MLANDTLNNLYNTILNRKENHVEGSYTCYLFQEGLNKILKKCGEECSEVIIAAKDGDPGQIKAEICDLIYHLVVLMAEMEIEPADIDELLKIRSEKVGNLKPIHETDTSS